MKQIIIVLSVLGLLALAVPFISVATTPSPCSLSIYPPRAPLGGTRDVILTLSGVGMSGVYHIMTTFTHTAYNNFTLTLPSGTTCSAGVFVQP